MGRHKQTDALQGNTMEQYTTPVPLPQRQEVWGWLEMWDKVAPGGTEGTGGVTHQASGMESPYWRSRDAGRLVDAGTGGSAVDSHHRVEIQQNGTMAVVATDLAGDTVLEWGLGASGDPAVA
ncbi:hypothetical protein NDU88_002231 [Pleurodeles waltl]|uniref:Uncharacterized protein n=1 Tax=Pleurodeles waltl TaxID=8319 RepID=A0AAV7KRN2_PLEWA|nr:hypothetical protein NDU88_002231 [Pleurodeles waltl]